MKKLYSIIGALLLGTAASFAQDVFPLPFREDFDHHDNFSFIDSNLDNLGFGLLYNPQTSQFGSIRYDDRDAFKSADDWIIFPYFQMKKGLTYTVTVSMRMSGQGAAIFDCHFGNDNDDMDDIAIKSWVKANSEQWVLAPENLSEWKEYSIDLVSPVEGNYRLALHFTSPINTQTYEMDWLTISEGMTAGAPDKSTCSTPTYKAVDGKLNVSFNITAPTVDCYGDPLSGSLSGKVVRLAEGKPAKTFEIASLTQGQAYAFTDPDGYGIPAEYDVYVCNGTIQGLKTIVTSKPTISKPAAPKNIVISHGEGNTFTANWDAVTTGESSFYPFLPASVTYSATNHTGADLELTMTSPNSATFEYPEVTEGQVAAFINLYASNEGGKSKAGKSNSVVIGQPLTGTFKEDFTGKKFNAQVWTPVPATGAWSVSSTSIKGTDGQAGILGYGQSTGNTAELFSPILDLSSMERPFVSMYVYIKPKSTCNNTIQPVIRGYEDTVDYPLCEAFTDHTLVDGSELPASDGWHKYTWQIKDVPAEKLAKCNLVLKGTGAVSYTYIYMDEITIKDYPHDVDLAITAVTIDKEATVGKAAPVKVTVTNKGFEAFGAFSVDLLEAGKVISTAECTGLEAETSPDLILTYTALPHQASSELNLSVALHAEGDQSEANNSADAVLKVALNLLPTARDFSVSFGSTADELTWAAPEEGEPGRIEVNEGFDEWAAGAIPSGTLNGWIFYDIDGNLTWGYDSSDPAYKQAIAAEIHPLGGNGPSNGLLVPKCNNQATGGVYGTPDKWIILPLLEEGSTVTLQRYVKNCYGNASRAEVDYCAATNGEEPDEFTIILASEKIADRTSAEWTTKTFTLPEGCNTFAIHVRDCQASFIAFDNFNFIQIAGAPSLEGFNVYRNNTLVTTLDATTLSYTINHENISRSDDQEERSYYISSLFDQGESGASEIITGKYSSLNSISAEEAFTTKGRTVFANTAVEIYDLSGRQIASVGKGGTATLEAGVYLISCGDTTVKIMLK